MTPTLMVYQAYGAEAILQECLWSLLSLARRMPAAEWPLVVIYTDRPDWFKAWPIPVPIDFQQVDAATIQAWRGPHQFVHRFKIEMLLDVQRRYPNPVLYLDTDTEFTQSPAHLLQRIAAGDRFMHVSEGSLARAQQPVLNKLLSFFRKQGAFPELSLQVSPQTEMWNAGVLGVPAPGTELPDRALQLTDALYPKYPKHIVEQFAFSVAYQEHSTVHSAAPWIFHYWNFKEWRLWLAAFLDRFRNAGWDELVHQSSLLPIHVPLQEKMGFYQGRSLWGKIRKERWQPWLSTWDVQDREDSGN